MNDATGAGGPAAGEASAALDSLNRPPRLRGALETWRGGVIEGWALDLGAPDRPLAITLEAAGRPVARLSTSRPRKDFPAPLANNVAGFTLELTALPAQALAEVKKALQRALTKPADAPTLLLRLADNGPHLDLGRFAWQVSRQLEQQRAAGASAAEPVSAEAASRSEPPAHNFAPNDLGNLGAAPRKRAGVDGLVGAAMRGWAVDLDRPQMPVVLRLEAEGRPVLELSTSEHRADLASILPGNRAGFALDLAALPPQAATAVLRALARAEQNAPTPPSLLALRFGADGPIIPLSTFGAPSNLPAPIVEAEEEESREVVEAPKRRRPAARSAIGWIIAHIRGSATSEATGRPSRIFAEKLLADLAASSIISETVKRHAAAITPLFDPFFYLDRLPAPDEAIANPLLHYTLAGWREGRKPCALFDPAYYRDQRGDFAGDPLLDFVQTGADLGADPHPLFDISHYARRSNHGDENPLAHYLEFGGAERIEPSPLFDTNEFLEEYQLGDEIAAPLETFLTTPAYYEFLVIPAFDAALYRYQLEVERKAPLDEPPIAHYLARGHRDETLLPNLLFDPAHYRSANQLDFKGPALLHYLTEGETLGHACHPLFSPPHYNRARGASGPGGALEHALSHPGEHVSDPRMEGPIDVRLFAFVRELVAENGVATFSPRVYRDANPDVRDLDDRELKRHFRRHGSGEDRIASHTSLMRLAELEVRDLPLGFVLDDYVSIYRDLKNFKGHFLNALFHWGRFGRHERRLIGKWLFRLPDLELALPTAGAPLRVAEASERVDVCILIHAFYPEMLPELIGFAQNFREVSFDIFINVVDLVWTPELAAEVRAICPGAFLMASNDLGRDIGGFTRLLANIDIGRYDVFAFMHSKKSPHIASESGEYWRRALLNAFAGSVETANACVKLFHDNPRVGLVGASEWRSQDMGKNVEQYEKLLDLLEVRGRNRELDYVSGFMFLVRSEVVARLFEVLHKLDFEYGGDKDLDFHVDGQIAHGVERATPALVRQMGYEVVYR